MDTAGLQASISDPGDIGITDNYNHEPATVLDRILRAPVEPSKLLNSQVWRKRTASCHAAGLQQCTSTWHEEVA
jgi:hypothetical protein